VWKYLNYAVSDVDGVAHFTKQSKEKNAGFEGGSIRSKTATDASARRSLREDAADDQNSARGGNTKNAANKADMRARRLEVETEEVNMTTIDSYVRRFALPRVDLMKIDTEGQDNKVLTGAASTIADIGMFTFEGGKGVTFSKEMIDQYDQMGFSCYSTSRAGLFKWNSGCTKDKYMGGFRAKDKGNIFCVSRKRAPMATLAYDILSFPMMVEEYLEPSEGVGRNAEAVAAFREVMTDEVKMAGMDGGVLVPIYLNIKPFCSPFPQCIAA
jgi:FkbM family methyltransferase